MKRMILIILGMAYILNSPILQWIYPGVSDNYYQFIEFIQARNQVYEIMFTGFFLLVFLYARNLTKAIACFFLVLASGSVVDKTVFHVTKYLLSDIILLIVAILISIKVYAGENKHIPE